MRRKDVEIIYDSYGYIVWKSLPFPTLFPTSVPTWDLSGFPISILPGLSSVFYLVLAPAQLTCLHFTLALPI
jgi:hypothetical protein